MGHPRNLHRDVIAPARHCAEELLAGLSLAEFILRSPTDNFNAVLDEQPQQLHEGQYFRLAINNRQVDHAERRLHRRELIQIVQDHQTLLAPFQLDDDPHAMAVAFIANVADPFDSLIVNQFCDLFD